MREGAVFSCARNVAEGIVVHHQREREQLRDRLRAAGYGGDDLDARVDTSTTTMYWPGDDLVIDERGLLANPRAITWVPPGPDGTYIING
jgi:hypothetical protein